MLLLLLLLQVASLVSYTIGDALGQVLVYLGFLKQSATANSKPNLVDRPHTLLLLLLLLQFIHACVGRVTSIIHGRQRTRPGSRLPRIH
jgi:hypothetical protein